jgi:streptogramin lyase
MKGTIVRLDPGPNPPATALAEVYNVPLPGSAPRGADIDSQGVVWVSLGSGHLGSFDRRKCKGPLVRDDGADPRGGRQLHRHRK